MPPKRRTTRKNLGVEEVENEEIKVKDEAVPTAAPAAAPNGAPVKKKRRTRRTITEPVLPSDGELPRRDQDTTKTIDKQQPNGQKERKRRGTQNTQENSKMKKVKKIKKEEDLHSVIKTSSKTNRGSKSQTFKSEETTSSPGNLITEEKSLKSSDTEDSDFEEVDSGGSVSVHVKDRSSLDGTTDLDIAGTKQRDESAESDFEEIVSTSVNKGTSKKTRTTKHDKKAVTKKSIGSQKGKKRTKTGEKKDISKAIADLKDPTPSVPVLRVLDEDDVTAVLLHMEGSSCSLPSTSEGHGQRGSEVKGSSLSDDTDGSEDWEEVEEHDGRSLLSRVPTEPVEITLEAPDFFNKRRKKKQFDWQGYVQRTMRRFQKDVQVNMHKVHLLCLLAHGLQQNMECNSEILRALALSILPSDRSITSIPELKIFVKWFQHEFPLLTTSTYFDRPDEPAGVIKSDCLQSLLSNKQISSAKALVIVFVIMLRCLGIDVRLVMSLQPMKMKLAERDKFNVKQKSRHKADTWSEKQNKEECEDAIRNSQCASSRETGRPTVNKTGVHSTEQKNSKCPQKREKTKSSKRRELSQDDSYNDVDRIGNGKQKQMNKKNKQKSKRVNKGKETSRQLVSHDDNDTENEVKQEEKDRDIKPKRRKLNKGKPLSEEITSSDDEEDEVKMERSLRVRVSRRSDRRLKQEEDLASLEEEEESEEEFVVEEKKKTRRKSLKRSEPKCGRRSEKLKGKVKKERNLSSESEFETSETHFRSPLQEKLKKNRKVLSSDSERSDTAQGRDTWAEVFLSGEDRWVCVDCVNNIIDKPYEVEGGATQPVHYVLAYTSADYVSDITARYASQWMSQTRKLRVDADWWKETLESYRSPLAEQSEKDEEMIKDQLLSRPLPTSIGEFKNHPLYALPRHLLKFEAIYPTTAAPFGYIRGEAIYARECVHTLHSRENWLKEGRCVRIGEEAYKMVKSRKKWRETKPNPDALDLELFGSWQTEKYIPPPAVDGKITRNVYGNIELFKPWMLPAGTVHLQGFPALNRIAKKLDMDCVPAMVGWDSHGGFPHPLIDGWVVCEEQKDILIAAWDEEQEIQREREIERREKRVYGNWKLLIRSLLIRERLKKKFDLKDGETEEEEGKEEAAGKGKKGKVLKKPEKGEKATDIQQSWPQNRKQKNKEALKHSTETETL